jgi:hypothetical protein
MFELELNLKQKKTIEGSDYRVNARLSREREHVI